MARKKKRPPPLPGEVILSRPVGCDPYWCVLGSELERIRLLDTGFWVEEGTGRPSDLFLESRGMGAARSEIPELDDPRIPDVVLAKSMEILLVGS